MKKARVLVIGLAMIFVAVNGAYAQKQEKYHQVDQEKKESIFKELNLTPEQKKKLEDNRTAQDQELSRLRAAMKEKHQKLQQELNKPEVTRAAVEPLVNEIKSLQEKLLDHRINGIFAVKTILTPEQFVNFNQIMKKQMKEKRGKMRQGDWQEKSKSAPSEKE
jgi:Spy/CpxP family protein refolding chaperone